MTSTSATGRSTAIAPWTNWSAPRRHVLRFPAALLLLVTAAVHIPLVSRHLHEAPYIGVLFITLALVCTALSALLLAYDCAPIWLATGVASGAAVAAYVLSRSIGMPQIGDDIGKWLDPLGIAALSAETLTVLLTAWVLRSRAPNGVADAACDDGRRRAIRCATRSEHQV
jgi:hypothetical protein